MDRELREREITELQRRIDNNPPPGCLKGIAGYFGTAFLMFVAAIVITFMTESWELGALIYTAGLIGFLIQWTLLRSRHGKLKSRLNSLLDEERRDIDREKE